ncbi:MAG TPA: NtaA/DmoA family FMN-dependent monooxygenase [Enteractinococcus sp.]
MTSHVYQSQSSAKPFASSIPCAAMIFPPLFQFAGAWRHPGNRTDWLRTSFWTDLGRQLDADGYDMLFIPDAMAMARGHDGTTDAVIASGAKGGIYLDPITVMAAVAAVTEHMRLGCTLSTSFVPAYDIARRIATLHQLSGGRAAWNIVTSAYDYEAQNMGLPRLAPKEERYRIAHQITQQVVDIWQTFPDEALWQDTETGLFADASVIQPTEAGIGPLTLPGDVAGHRPMLLQAGASPTGMDFAAQWADATFMVAANGAQAQQIRADLRDRATRAGRDPNSITTLMGIQPVVAETETAAQDKLQRLKDLIDPTTAWRDLATLFRADPNHWALNDSAEEFLRVQRGATGAEGFENIVAEIVAKGATTIGELAVTGAIAQFKPVLVGTPASVAQQMVDLVARQATDGFMIMGTVVPESFTDFAPVLRLLNESDTHPSTAQRAQQG